MQFGSGSLSIWNSRSPCLPIAFVWLLHYHSDTVERRGSSHTDDVGCCGSVTFGQLIPFTVGAHVGTMVAGILSAVNTYEDGMTVALSQLCFNLFDALVWFPLSFMRAFPTSRSNFFGQCGS